MAKRLVCVYVCTSVCVCVCVCDLLFKHYPQIHIYSIQNQSLFRINVTSLSVSFKSQPRGTKSHHQDLALKIAICVHLHFCARVCAFASKHVCVYVCVCVCVCVSACVCVCVCVCVWKKPSRVPREVTWDVEGYRGYVGQG